MSNTEQHKQLCAKQHKSAFMAVIKSMTTMEFFDYITTDIVPDRLKKEYEETKVEYDELQRQIDILNEEWWNETEIITKNI